MERTEVLEMMGELKLYGMKSAYDETLATALKRKHEPQQLVCDLLKAEISEKQARSIRYQLTTAKLPLAKDVNERHSSSGAEPRSLSCTPSRIDDRPDPKKTGRQAELGVNARYRKSPRETRRSGLPSRGSVPQSSRYLAPGTRLSIRAMWHFPQAPARGFSDAGRGFP